jgi:hypothetical protein
LPGWQSRCGAWPTTPAAIYRLKASATVFSEQVTMAEHQFPNYCPPDAAMAKRWRHTLETMGVAIVRARLAQSPGGSAAIIRELGTEHITKGFVENWLREHEAAIQREDLRRYRTLLTWTVVAGLAGIVAAIAGLIAVIKG